MHREVIKAKIRMAFRSMSDFERARGLPAESVRDVLRGRSVAKTEAAIAAQVGAKLHELFPLRYAAPEPGEGLPDWDDSSRNRDDTKRSRSPAHRLSAGGR